jgi:hypothetical protein
MFNRVILSTTITLLTGCAAYHAPGRGADLSALGVTAEAQKAGTSADINASFDKRPLANFPAGVAVVRIQAPGYQSPTAQGFGGGAYSIVLTRDVEPDDAMQRLAKLPMVRGIAPIGRLLMPNHLTSDKELRQAAAQLQADLLLVYTLDTTFHDRDLASPLSVVTLGLSPTQSTTVITTASAVLMDTRNGYIYGVSEASARKNGLATAWNTTSAIDGNRKRTETEAFQKLVGEIETMWKGVVQENGPNALKRGTRYPTGG